MADSGREQPEREPMDSFMERTKDAGYPASIRRLAWLTGEPMAKVFRQFEAIKQEHGRGT